LRQEEGGKLVGERLPAAGGQEAERIATRERRVDHVALAGTEQPDAKPFRGLASDRSPVDGAAGRPPAGRRAPLGHALEVKATPAPARSPWPPRGGCFASRSPPSSTR